MVTEPDEKTLAELLPGTWRVAGTNFPLWIRGARRHPTFTYAIRAVDPLVLDDTVSYETADGTAKQIVGVDTWRDGHFVWRGTGLLSLARSQWSVTGVTSDGAVAAIRFTKSFLSPAGIDIVVRDGAPALEPRTLVAVASERFGLSAEDFATLTWLEQRA